MDYPFHDSLCTAAPSPQKKSEKGCLWGRGAAVQGLVSDGQSTSSSSVKTVNNKMPVSSFFNDSEGLYRTTVCRCLVCRPHYSSRQMRFGSRVQAIFFFSDTPPKYPKRDFVGRRRTGTRHGNVYRSIREKQGVVVYRQRVLQTVASLRIVSLVLRGHDLLKISNINPQQEARFSLWKKNTSPRERRKWSLGLVQHLKGAWPNVRSEPKYPGNKKTQP